MTGRHFPLHWPNGSIFLRSPADMIPITYGHWCQSSMISLLLTKRAFEQIAVLPVIWDAIIFMWCNFASDRDNMFNWLIRKKAWYPWKIYSYENMFLLIFSRFSTYVWFADYDTTVGFNDISWNNAEVKTPNLQAMAEQGIILDRNYAQPVCSPWVITSWRWNCLGNTGQF